MIRRARNHTGQNRGKFLRILKVGEMDKEAANPDAPDAKVNRYALFIEEAGGMEKIHDCQNNAKEEIYMNAYNIIEKYFSDEDEQADDAMAANSQGPNGTYGFGAPNGATQQGGFNFGNGGDSMDM